MTTKKDEINLSELTRDIAYKNVQMQDNTIKQYVESSIKLLQSQGKDITDYALIMVSNPMELKDNNLRVSSQWRIIKTSELQNSANYNEGV